MKIIIIFNILILLGLSPFIQADNIKWRVIDWKPMYIEKGENKNEGIYDNIISLFSKNLTSYKHEKVVMTTSRVIHEMASGTKVCHPSVLFEKNTKQSRSLMNSILLPLQIIVNNNSMSKFSNLDNYSLKTLLNNKNLKGGLVIGRYTKGINEIIKGQKDKKHLFLSRNYDGLIQMLLSNRVDYIIEYSIIVNFKAKELNILNNTTSIDIKDMGDIKYLPVYTACPGNEWGEKVIKQIDEVLITESKNKDFIKSRIKWFKPDDQKKLIELYNKYYFRDK